MKRPDEIKKGMECCITDKCRECPYYHLFEVFGCKLARAKDALAYIQQLEQENERLLNSYDSALCEAADLAAMLPKGEPT